MSGKLRSQAMVRCSLSLMLAVMAMVAGAMPAHAVGQPSTYPGCATRNVTVAYGGTVNVNLTTCHFFGLGIVSTAPTHGSVTPGDPAPVDTYNYTHNGSSGTTDTFVVLDDNSDFITVNVTITPPTSSIVVSPSSLSAMAAGSAFSQSLSSNGGVAPYTYTLNRGSLPLGLSLSSSGVISGTPTARSNYSFTVRSTDSTKPIAQFVDKGYTGVVSPAPLSISPASATAIQSVAFSQALSVTGGVAPHSFQLESGSFPAGISLSGTGAVSGTTSAAPGNYNVTIRVTDSSAGVGTHFELEPFTLTVAALPTVSIAVAPSVTAEDGATNLAYTVTRSVTSASALTVNLTTSGTASSASDYTGSVASVTIPANASSATVTINPTADVLLEGNETVILALATGSGYTLGSPLSATGTISNDDDATGSPSPLCPVLNATVANGGSVQLNVSSCDGPFDGGMSNGGVLDPVNGSYTIGANSGGVQFVTYVHNGNSATSDRFELKDNENGIVTVNITITAPTSSIVVSPSSLSAMTAGAAFSQTLTSSGGVASYTYTLDSGTLPIGLTLSSGGAITGTPTQRGGYAFSIRSTDSTTPTAQSVIKSYTGTVANPTLTLTTTIGTAIQGVPFTQTLATTGGVAPYTYALELSALPTGLTLSGAGVILGTTSVAPGNYLVTLRVGESSTPSAAPIFELENYTLTVSPPPSVSIAVAPASVTEDGAANLVYTVTRSLNLSSPTTVNITTGGTATSGTDYTGGVTTVTIPAGVTTATITVGPTVDTSVEPNETVILTVAAGSGYTVGAPSAATGTITNDDASSLTINDVTLNEGSAGTTNATFTVSLSAPAGPGGVTFDIGTANGTATGGVDYVTRILGAQIIAAGSSTYAFDVLINGDVLNEANETFFVNVTNPAGATVADGQGLGTITNDDALPSLSTSNISVAEGNSGTANAVVTVTLSAASGQTVTVNYAAANGSATSPADYTAASGVLTFAPGETSKTITVPVIGETVPEANETFSVVLSAAVNATINVATSLVTITNDDVPVVVSPGSLPGGTVGTSYSQTITASGGVSPYSFAVTTGALPSGVTLTGDVLSGMPTANGAFTFTVTATDSSGAPGPFSANQAYTITMAAPVVTLPVTSLPRGIRDTAYSATLNPASGGTAPFNYAVTGGALPTGLVLSSNGIFSGAATVFGTFAFTVTAADSSTGAGPYSAVQSYTLAIVDQAPVAAGVAVTLPYGAAATPIILNLTGGAATLVAVASPPANGTATISGTTISYQPNASFSGTDSFSYTATNDGGTSAPATVTITVGAPTLSVTASGPLNAVVGAPYSQTFTFAGGTAPFGSQQIAGLPAGLALTETTANSVTLSGSSRAQGTFTLSVSASDSSTGNGPFVARQEFTLTVAAPVLALAPASGSFTANYAAPFSQSVTASGGIGSYSYALGGSLPAGVTFDTATGLISGTPTATGNFAFTVIATDKGAIGPGAPFTVQGSYTLAISTPTIAVTPTNLPVATAGTAYSATLAGSGAVAPYSFTLASGALPVGITLSATGQLTGTPTASGSFPFTVTARDANGQTGTTSLTLAVNVPTIVITPATLPVAMQGIVYNQTVTASGGIAPYSFTVSSGSLPVGLTLNPVTGAITGTPSGSGIANFAITVTDSTGGTAATATITYALQVTARPDPASDPEVRGLVQAQVMATRRFADAQVNNFMRRLEDMHGDGGASSGGGFRNSLRFSAPGYCQDSVTALTNSVCAESESKFGPVAAANGGDAGGEGSSANGSDNMPWTIWAGGTIRFGDRDPATGRLSQKFESEGITFGGDYRFSPSFAAGVGVGLGRDTVDIGDNGSRSSGEAKTIAVYGSHALGSGIYVDWLGGYQALDFDLRRYVTPTGLMINSTRSGRQWFAIASTGADIETGNWLIMPYARIDMTHGRLSGYTENSGSLFDLTFLDQDVDFTSLGLGARVNYRHIFKGGTLLPRLRIEYQYDLERNAVARVAYFDRISGPFSTIPLTGLAREQLMLGAGAELQLEGAVAFEFEYLNRIASGSGSDQSVQVGVKVKF